MKYFRKMIPCVLAVCLCCSMLFGDLGTDLGLTGPADRASAATISEKPLTWNRYEKTYKGSLSKTKKEQKYYFHLDHTSHVKVVCQDSVMPSFRVRVYAVGKSGSIAEEKLFPGVTDTYVDVCLLAGDYYIRITDPGTENGVQKWGSFSLKCSAVSCKDTVDEAIGTNDHLLQNAIPIITDRTYYGSIADNESTEGGLFSSKCDIYKIHHYSDEWHLNVYFSSQCYATLYLLKKGKDGGVQELYHGDFNGKTDRADSRRVDFSSGDPGDYYLAVTADHAGDYHFVVQSYGNSDAASHTHEVGALFIEKGETISFSKAAGFSYDPSAMLWETSEEEPIRFTYDGRIQGLSWDYRLLKGYYIDPSTKEPKVVRVPIIIQFTDVDYVDDWIDRENRKYYFEPVYWAAKAGITGGVKDPDGIYRRFDPQGECTRGQMISFLWRMEGCPEPSRKISHFSDISSKDYFYKAVIWAEENSITGGYSDGTFRPNEKCNRAQAVTFLYRLEGQPEVTKAPGFKDVRNKNAYYYNAVSWARQYDIVGGYDDNTFRPNGVCTRAQMVTFLYRYHET